METDFGKVIGKTEQAVANDIAEFLSAPFSIDGIDLFELENKFSMKEQFAYAFLMEAKEQGLSQKEAQECFLKFCAEKMDRELLVKILSAFSAPAGMEFSTLSRQYGARFTLSDHHYWAACIRLGVSKGASGLVLHKLQEFMTCIMEFAYMGNRRPKTSYVWGYYESFADILQQLSAPETASTPLTVKALGGSTGEKTAEGYFLSIGVDIENPSEKSSACGVVLELTFKDVQGETLATHTETLGSISPKAIFHYGVTLKIAGSKAVANIAALAKATCMKDGIPPFQKAFSLTKLICKKGDTAQSLCGAIKNLSAKPAGKMTLYYQYLGADGKIVGGGKQVFEDGMRPAEERPFVSRLEMHTKPAAKIVYSMDSVLYEA